MKLVEKEVCPRCKQKFDCSKSNKCWCFEIGLETEQLEKLGNEYDGCLCKNCIEELAAEK